MLTLRMSCLLPGSVPQFLMRGFYWKSPTAGTPLPQGKEEFGALEREPPLEEVALTGGPESLGS
jgi:hypothetical protein